VDSNAPGARIQPGLKHHRGRSAVDPLPSLTVIQPLAAQSSPGFLRAEPFIDELDGQAGALLELLTESTGAPRRGALATIQAAREAQDEAADVLLVRQCRERIEHARRVSSVEITARVGDQAELVGHGHPDAYFSEVDSSGAHVRERLARARIPDLTHLAPSAYSVFATQPATGSLIHFRAFTAEASKTQHHVLPGRQGDE
jgi:hypothetical protein